MGANYNMIMRKKIDYFFYFLFGILIILNIKNRKTTSNEEELYRSDENYSNIFESNISDSVFFKDTLDSVITRSARHSQIKNEK